ncbi:hypothetical protein ANO11243_086400 [Dothideomycetidae sp. 11243]|nr:hypothetical protein ANO11243_086400 [fungal sp. No.11243]
MCHAPTVWPNRSATRENSSRILEPRVQENAVRDATRCSRFARLSFGCVRDEAAAVGTYCSTKVRPPDIVCARVHAPAEATLPSLAASAKSGGAHGVVAVSSMQQPHVPHPASPPHGLSDGRWRQVVWHILLEVPLLLLPRRRTSLSRAQQKSRSNACGRFDSPRVRFVRTWAQSQMASAADGSRAPNRQGSRRTAQTMSIFRAPDRGPDTVDMGLHHFPFCLAPSEAGEANKGHIKQPIIPLAQICCDIPVSPHASHTAPPDLNARKPCTAVMVWGFFVELRGQHSTELATGAEHDGSSSFEHGASIVQSSEYEADSTASYDGDGVTFRPWRYAASRPETKRTRHPDEPPRQNGWPLALHAARNSIAQLPVA